MSHLNPTRPAAIYFVRMGEDTLVRSGDMVTIENDVRYWLGKSPGLYINEYDRIYAVELKNEVELTYCIQKFHDQQREYNERARLTERKRLYESLKEEFDNPNSSSSTLTASSPTVDAHSQPEE